MSDWNIQDARELYKFGRWDEGYFDLNDEGDLVARPHGPECGTEISLSRLATDIHNAGLSLPVLVRFPDILHHRVNSLCGAFDQVMTASQYQAGFTAIYPIKVNQQRRVVEEIVNTRNGQVGLEAGSKPELLAVMALSRQNGFVICNGYKDSEYIELALIGQQLGLQVHIVVEKLSELELVLKVAQQLDVKPVIGVRVRLASIATGKWQNTGGDRSKFGLSAHQIVQVIERLQSANMLDSLQMLHFHMGSQVPDLDDIDKAMKECAQFYAQLHQAGADIRVVDVGGGLGVDYEGTHSQAFCSMNYRLQDYAEIVVNNLSAICQRHDLPQPHILTESGRALTAHHAALITDVLEVEQASHSLDGHVLKENDSLVVKNLWNAMDNLNQQTLVQSYHDATDWLAEAQAMFSEGQLPLEQRALAEQIYFATCWKIRNLLEVHSHSERHILDALNKRLADKYFCNFSLFQSVPDAWAIQQIFPVVPLHRHNECPQRRGVVFDITCDSDGRMDHYVDSEGIEPSLPLHALRNKEQYLLGIFMVGAYQEILGDMHNLFGDTDSVNVVTDDQGNVTLDCPARGNTVDDVLRYVDFNSEKLLELFNGKLGASTLDTNTRAQYQETLVAGFKGYTYLEDF